MVVLTWLISTGFNISCISWEIYYIFIVILFANMLRRIFFSFILPKEKLLFNEVSFPIAHDRKKL